MERELMTGQPARTFDIDLTVALCEGTLRVISLGSELALWLLLTLGRGLVLV